MISEATVRFLAKKFKINPLFSTAYLHYAINVETEHVDTVGSNPEMAFKIVIDHLREYPDYYYALKKMEKGLDKKWNNRIKPTILLGAL